MHLPVDELRGVRAVFVRLVGDLLAQQLLERILESDEAHHYRRLVHHRRQVALAALEQINEREKPLAPPYHGKLAHGERRHRSGVLGPQHDALLHQEHAHQVFRPQGPPPRLLREHRRPAAARIHRCRPHDRHARVTLAQQACHCALVHHSALTQQGRLRQRRHHVARALAHELERALENERLVIAQPTTLALDARQRLELRAAVSCDVGLAERRVERLCNRPRDGRGEPHERRHQRRGGRAHLQAVSAAHRLRQNLAHEQHQQHRDCDGHLRAGDLVQQQRQPLHRGCVAQQQRHQQPVLRLGHLGDARGGGALLGAARARDHLEVGRVLREQPQRQPGHEPAKRHAPASAGRQRGELGRAERYERLGGACARASRVAEP